MPSSTTNRSVGLTKDTGFQIGARRTLPIALDTAWEMLTSQAGIALWLGEIVDNGSIDWHPGEAYAPADGSRGEARVFKPHSHVRLTWQLPGWERPSTIQVRVIANGDRTVIAFHQEHLPDAAARADRCAYFAGALDRLERIMSADAIR